MELVGMIEDLNIHQLEAEANLTNKEDEAEGIDDLIAKMEKVTIEKD